MSIASSLTRLGEIATLDELVSAGHTSRSIQRAADGISVIRVRRGWYASASADPAVVRAVRVGGSLTCVSGCARLGVWVLPDHKLHVAVVPHARNLKHPEIGASRTSTDHVVIHWTAADTARGTRGVQPLVNCLIDALHCQEPEVAFAMLESAISKKLLSRSDRRVLERRLIPRLRFIVENAGKDAGSGSESLFRFRMILLGVTMQSQVDIPGVGRVDFVVGDRLVVEIDSAAHHAGLANRLRDLHRDAILVGLGFISLRFDYQQILHDWDTVVSTVMAAIDRGDHLRR